MRPLALALVLSSGLATAQNARVQVQDLGHPDGPLDWNTFGAGAAIRGDYAAIGTSAGEQDVVVYRWSNDRWEVDAMLPSPVGEPNGFGSAIAMDGDVLAVGAPNADLVGSGSGAVVLYRHSGGAWVQEAILTAPDAAPGDDFGFAVTVDGDRLLASAPKHELAQKSGYEHGAVYAWEFALGQWTYVGKLIDQTPHSVDWFGYSLDLDGERAIVGELPGGYDDWGSSHRGEAHVFEWSNNRWNRVAELVSPTLSKTYGFGVAVDGDRIVVTDFYEGHRVYEGGGGTWNQVALLESDGDGPEVGLVVIEGDRILFGMDASDFLGVAESKVVQYAWNGASWELVEEFHLADPVEPNMRLVAADGSRLFTVAPVLPRFVGRVYAYDASKPSLGTSICTANMHDDGGPGRLQAFGSQAVADNDLSVCATRVQKKEFTLLLMSDTPGSSTLGAGHLCLSGKILRFPSTLANSGPNGAIGAQIDVGQLPDGTVFLPGSTWYFQAWFRSDATVNLTDAIGVTWL